MRSRAGRMRDIQPFRVMELLARARKLEAQGRDIVHMEIGEPDFPTPAPVIDAVFRATASGDVHYTPATGLSVLREAIAVYYLRHDGVALDPARVVVTPGASGALLLVLGVVLDPGQAVLMADPGYPCNRNFVHFLDGRTRAIPVTADTGYQLTAQQVAEHWDETTAAVMVASPSNPTGTLIPTDELRQIRDFVARQGGTLIVDEIYHGLVYDGQAETALTLGDDLFVINSFSKYFGLTGWRVGWLVAPAAVVPDLDKLAQNLFLAAPTPSQHAALAALQPDTLVILDQRREAFRQRRDYLLPALRDIGFDIPMSPQGAFYLYANCERFTADSFQFATTLLEEIGVAVTPGLDFGNNQPEKHLRFAYTTSRERLEEGVQRLKAYL
ncbi:MAG: pyridoxal phosphate-dependent aminotransferase [Proteobacteria bacterium]|jgi:aspartate/methionine/tyrosine aminotransferase|nr:pyridoxal phosphate-dependent aminotransferase [Pseudomonadota bacterium]